MIQEGQKIWAEIEGLKNTQGEKAALSRFDSLKTLQRIQVFEYLKSEATTNEERDGYAQELADLRKQLEEEEAERVMAERAAAERASKTSPVDGAPSAPAGPPPSDGSDFVSGAGMKLKAIPERDYFLCETELTQAQWSRVMESNPSRSQGDDYPVETVAWADAMEFCRRLTELDRRNGVLPPGYVYALPTKEQWEFACGAGGTEDYGAELDLVAWYGQNLSDGTNPVKMKKPNAWGFFDMLGNVEEWCLDGSEVGTRPCPGGGILDTAEDFANAYGPERWRVDTFGLPYLGFRPVAVPESSLNSEAKALLVSELSDPESVGDRSRSGMSEAPPDISFTTGVGLRLLRVPDRDYYLGDTEVTQGQWAKVMGKVIQERHGEDAFNVGEGADHPMYLVTWLDAMEFCRRLTEQDQARKVLPEGYVYTLPTQDQWEYACRAGSTGDYAGDLDAMAWYSANAEGRTHLVSSKQPNRWGFFDMHGNVYEWCADGDGEGRVTRGGAWYYDAEDCRSENVNWLPEEDSDNCTGFRVAAVLQGSIPMAEERRESSQEESQFMPGNVNDNSIASFETGIGLLMLSVPDRDYFLGESELTQGQWQRLMGTTVGDLRDMAERDKARHDDGQRSWALAGIGKDQPMYFVSWDEAMEFCHRLTIQDRKSGKLLPGYEYTLPTEEQWEYACRAGSTADYAGDAESMAWYGGNSGGSTHDVKSKQPNSWGFYDMHGNVWEWCRNEYDKGRANRGGSWYGSIANCRSSHRGSDVPSFRGRTLGFRPAAVPIQ